MNALTELINLPPEMKEARGLEYTPGEIARQPRAWAATYLKFQSLSVEVGEFLRSAGIGDSAERRPTVFLIGAGSSDYIGRSLVDLARSQWQCDVVAVASTDLLTDFESLLLPGRDYLWISFSRSGESPEAVAVLEQALRKRPDIKHIIVSCNQRARLLRCAAGKPQVFSIVLDEWANDLGLAMTSSFSSMLVCGQCIVHAHNLSEYAPILQRVIANGEALISSAANLAAGLASNAYRKACFVGGGPLRGIASECALKVLELTGGKTHGMSESPLGLRHGPMAALDKDTLFVCLLSTDKQRRDYETDLLRQIRSKDLAKTSLVINCDSSAGAHDLADYNLPSGRTFSIADYYRGPADVIAGQLLGLFFSLHWNLKPDSPSINNAISRIVENVQIYQ